jgi:antitoxin component YwqK of YwqJK toxin-antitoxin module
MAEASQSPNRIVVRDDEGEVVQEASMENGLLEGETVLYIHGRVRARLQFRQGKQDGESVFYDQLGGMTLKALYREGRLHGDSVYFDAAGRVTRKAMYQRDRLHGRTADYYPSGKPREIAQYQDNLLHGEVRKYSESGTLTERRCFQAGKERPCPGSLGARPPRVPVVAGTQGTK